MKTSFNIADKISIFRIILVPIIFLLIILGEYIPAEFTIPMSQQINYHFHIFWVLAGLVFIVACLSDFLDGFIARRKKIVSTQGIFLDAIADKILCNSVIISFLWLGFLNIYLAIFLIIRDFLIDTLRLINVKKNNNIIAANWIGKLKTIIIMIGLTVLFYFNNASLLTNVPETQDPHCPWYINQFVLLPMYLGAIFALISAVIYFSKNWLAIQKETIILKNKENI